VERLDQNIDGTERVAAILLAGGRSSRMGRDKARLAWGGETLLARQFAVLASVVGADRVLVSGQRPGYRSVVDEVLGRGPIEGVRSCLRYMMASADFASIASVLVIPVDMPLLRSEHLRSLLTSSQGVEVVKFRGFELPAHFRLGPKLVELLEDLCRATEGRSRSFQRLYAGLSLLECPVANQDALLNANTGEEWNVALSAGRTGQVSATDPA